jgi:hypothetical protein
VKEHKRKASTFLNYYKNKQRKPMKPGVVGHTCNTSTREAQAGGWRLRGQFELWLKIFMNNKPNNKKS